MRTLLGILSVSLILAPAALNAQADRTPEDKAMAAKPSLSPSTGETPEEIRLRGKAWFTQCMADWDAATHMSKKEWERTCRRVALERTKFLIDQRGKK
jgi:hypothetical protein